MEEEVTPHDKDGKTALHKALIARLGAENVAVFPTKAGELPLLLLTFTQTNSLTALVTNGLSNYRMPVPPNTNEKEFTELYVCLPSYWDIHDLENAKMNWVIHWLQRLSSYVVAKNTWFGHGHTMPAGAAMQAISETMRQNHFFLSRPVDLERELQDIQVGETAIQFLALVPIYGDEMDYKQGKGTFKFEQKLRTNGVSEKLDDFRGSVLKSKWRFRTR
jgi:hypothetical protein